MLSDLQLRRGSLILGFSTIILPVIFLQSGINYYLSFQIVLLFSLLFLIFKAKPQLFMSPLIPIALTLFLIQTNVVAYYNPNIFTSNPNTVLKTIISISGYLLLVFLPFIFRSTQDLLSIKLLKFCAETSLAILCLTLIISELEIFPLLNREFFIWQNSGLITNSSSLTSIADTIAGQKRHGVSLDIDLFYGEKSYFVIVIFTLASSIFISDRILSSHGDIFSKQKVCLISPTTICFVVLSIFLMLYSGSFSSLFYSLTLTFYVARPFLVNNIFNLRLLAFVVFFSVFILLSFFDDQIGYYSDRLLNILSSGSFYQRIGVVFDYGLSDITLGLLDPSRLPIYGFHNGFLFLIFTSGMSGIFLFFLLMFSLYQYSKKFRLSFVCLSSVVFIFSQNGAIFSPNKVALYYFIILPFYFSACLYPRVGR